MGNFDFSQLFDSLSSKFGAVLPNVLSALLLLIVGLFIARVLRNVTAKGLRKSGVDNKFSSSSFSISKTVSKLVYYIIVIFVLLAVLNMMGISDALTPLQNMLTEITGYIPNIFAAGIIGFVGYTLANIAKEGVGFISGSVEKYTDKYGLSRDFDITALIKQLVFYHCFLSNLISSIRYAKYESYI